MGEYNPEFAKVVAAQQEAAKKQPAVEEGSVEGDHVPVKKLREAEPSVVVDHEQLYAEQRADQAKKAEVVAQKEAKKSDRKDRLRDTAHIDKLKQLWQSLRQGKIPEGTTAEQMDDIEALMDNKKQMKLNKRADYDFDMVNAASIIFDGVNVKAAKLQADAQQAKGSDRVRPISKAA